jgi:hypothetical protein
MGVGLNGQLESSLNTEQHRFDSQKMLFARFRRLFVVPTGIRRGGERSRRAAELRFVVPTKLGRREGRLGSERAMNNGLKGNTDRASHQHHFVFCVGTIFISVPIGWASLFCPKCIYPCHPSVAKLFVVHRPILRPLFTDAMPKKASSGIESDPTSGSAEVLGLPLRKKNPSAVATGFRSKSLSGFFQSGKFPCR